MKATSVRMVALGVFILAAAVLALAVVPSGLAEEVTMKCWKCGTFFKADSSQSEVTCPNCGARCLVPPSSPEQEAAEEYSGAAEEEAGPEVLTWREAMTRKGRYVVVEAKIVNVYDPDARGKKGPVKLNVDRNWRDSLTFVMFNRDGRFGNPSRFLNKTVRVQGTVGDYKGAVQIKVESPSDISIVETKAPEPAPAEEEVPVETEDAAAQPEDIGMEEVADYLDESTPEVAAEEAPMTTEAPAALTWQEAMNKLGQDVTVEAVIVNVYDPDTRGKSGPVKLNTDRDWNNSLTIVFFKKDRSGQEKGFPNPRTFLNKKVRVTGTVGEHKGAKQIMLNDPSQISIAE